jgi:hypothetical protein
MQPFGSTADDTCYIITENPPCKKTPCTIFGNNLFDLEYPFEYPQARVPASLAFSQGGHFLTGVIYSCQ